MANEAFALSPISASAAQPSEEDYEAIREAFMETARGRWFLTEYAKRNRNADTRMVLDAVSRIEETLADQRRRPSPDNKLAPALAAIRKTVQEATTAALAAIDNIALEENLTPVRKGMRIIKEISWRWREIGADGRVCDLIDLQVAAMEAACGQLAASDARNALNEAFDLIKAQLDGLANSDATASPEMTDHAVRPASPAGLEPQAVLSDAAHERTIEGEVGTQATAVDKGKAEVVAPADNGAELSPEAADARDEAVLEMVAFEMAAPDPSFEEGPDEPTIVPEIVPQIESAAPSQAETAVKAKATLPVIPESKPEPRASAIVPPPPPPREPAPESTAGPAREVSLGATIIASGIIKTPGAAKDPLAPIRRMSQAEKIAFFS